LPPEPLPDSGRKPLDLSGLCHPLKAAAFHRDLRVPPDGPLTLVDPDAGDLLPSLLGHYPVSTLEILVPRRERPIGVRGKEFDNENGRDSVSLRELCLEQAIK
jgi:hypothetical protein